MMMPHITWNPNQKQFGVLILLMMVTFFSSAQSRVIPLYAGVAPGSEQWNWQEGETSNTPVKFRIAFNVTKPTLTVYQPDTANGAGVILVPGGGMYVLNIEHEGETIAKQLVKKGLTVFVLKYRTGRTTTSDPWQEMLGNMKDTALNRRKLEGVRPLAIADAFAAIRLVRSRAAEFRVDPKKIGVVGFSAGGSLTLQLCAATAAADRPDFAGLIYTVYRTPSRDTLPATLPPAFIACAADDVLAPPVNSMALFDAWQKAKRPAELHIYAKGGHGLRGSRASGNWLARFEDWMNELGIIKQ